MFFIVGRPRSINEIKHLRFSFPASERRHIPIAVIDDESFQYKELLSRYGFYITEFNDINDVKAIEAFPIVICDIKGVGKFLGSKYEGAQLISEIKKFYPSKYVVAYSGHQFHPEYNEFFQIADDVLSKDIDSDQWVNVLDEAIIEALDPIRNWYKVRQYLIEKEIGLEILLRLENDYVDYIDKKTTIFPSEKTMKSLPADVKTVVLGLTSNALFQLIMSLLK